MNKEDYLYNWAFQFSKEEATASFISKNLAGNCLQHVLNVYPMGSLNAVLQFSCKKSRQFLKLQLEKMADQQFNTNLTSINKCDLPLPSLKKQIKGKQIELSLEMPNFSTILESASNFNKQQEEETPHEVLSRIIISRKL